jgi:hypothetical protein
MRISIYTHPDAGTIDYNVTTRELEITDGEYTIVFPIGSLGLIEAVEALAGAATHTGKLEAWEGAKP